MPIQQSSLQSDLSINEFYAGNGQVGLAMLAFIERVNATFIHTMLYAVIADGRLVLLPEDGKDDKRYIVVSYDGVWQMEYLLVGRRPWKDAFIKGTAETIEEAISYLIIAMTETRAWLRKKELRRRYNKLKEYTRNQEDFTLWLEFEAVDPGNWDIHTEFANVMVHMSDGRRYGVNVWTYGFLPLAVEMDKANGLEGLYLTPPDLFVKELTRDCIERSIRDLIKRDDLEYALNSTVLAYKDIDDDEDDLVRETTW